jgi:pimeloyl-ACP methyl ester carboxylesterase
MMIHGMWGSGAYWGNYRGWFEQRGWRVLTPTLRLHGGRFEDAPPAGLGTTSLRDYAANLERDIAALPEPPVLIGHSMGGLLAQLLAARGKAKAAVLLTPASPRGILALRLSVIRSFWSGLSRWGFWRKPYRQTFGEAAYSMLHLLPAAQQQAVYRTFCHESGRAAFEIGFWLLDLRRATEVDERLVNCPVLVISGAEDRITPAPVGRSVAAKYHAEYHVLPGHAHWVVGEPGWETIAELIADWLNRQGLRA